MRGSSAAAGLWSAIIAGSLLMSRGCWSPPRFGGDCSVEVLVGRQRSLKLAVCAMLGIDRCSNCTSCRDFAI